MRVLIVNIDSKIPNLALAKIEKYHRDRGDEITDYPLNANKVDKIYVSCVFRKNSAKAIGWSAYPNALIGGSGMPDVKNKLPDEIESILPRINLGFTTRGCIRHCPFCIVPAKEGGIKIVGDLLDLWDGGKSKEIKVLDNNILAVPKHFKLVCRQARDNHIKIDFNQGLDIRLVDEDIARELSTLRIKTIRFAWDNMADETIVRKNLQLLSKYVTMSKIMIYVLCGYNTTFAEDMYRRTEINKFGCDAYIMPYQKSRLMNEFSSWNNRFKYRNVPFEDYLKMRKSSYLAEGIKLCK